ncbi:hypothetical protein C9J48_27200 [Photobacterium profundum]|uniref:Ferric enterobactin transport protein n=1 Tax=Photobacterium profundum 3TCK TaxID=314280 RepID=Q1Z8B9_9GAMM|nr:Wzz/FepE/Etk N-terminal domain-containing protein [Photobacterium profundum]EAS44594.1 ferric enterobactin transport protein [Photobacterium profundum 3TCK]PSV56863.1 hypothetical protein C9J48_27200 [Photobacterium profundum]
MPSQIPNGNGNSEIGINFFMQCLQNSKWLLILCSLLTGIVASIYAFNSQEWWSSSEIITEANYNDLSSLRNDVSPLFIVAAKTEKLEKIFSPNKIFIDFINEYNKPLTKSEFILSNDLLKIKMSNQKLEEEQQKNAFVKFWSNKIKYKKQGDNFKLIFESNSAEESQLLLSQYSKFVHERVKNNIIDDVKSRIVSLVSLLEVKNDVLNEAVKANIKLEVEITKLALSVTKASNFSNPIENVNGDNFLPIELGSKALSEKYKVLSAVDDFSIFDPEIHRIKSEIKMLNDIDVNYEMEFNVIGYVNVAELPLNSDKPKRSLIVIIGLFIGLFLGCVISVYRESSRYYNKEK